LSELDQNGSRGSLGNGHFSMTWNTIWLPAGAGLQLGSNEVHIWRAFLDIDSTVGERLSAFPSSSEQERAARFAFAGDRDRFTVPEPSFSSCSVGISNGRPKMYSLSPFPRESQFSL
jgi:hypothetical protein